MRDFNYSKLKDMKWDSEIVGYLTTIHEAKVRQEFFLKNQPENFQLVSFDDSHWDEINVPSVWQTEGYSVPYYYASTFPKAFSRTKSKIPSIDHNMQEIGFYRKTFVLDEVFDNPHLKYM